MFWNGERKLFITIHSFVSADIYHRATAAVLFVATVSFDVLPAVHKTGCSYEAR